jgi:hypothetical protein
MTIPYERTRAILETRDFLKELQDPKLTPRVPSAIREIARKLARHYPRLAEIELAHKILPHLFGPVPPFSRLAGGEQTVAAIEAANCQVCVYEQQETSDGRIVMSRTCTRCGKTMKTRGAQE